MGLVYSASHAAGDGSARNAPAVLVFVGLKIIPEIASQLTQFAAALERAFARPVALEDIHITLVPPWNEISIPDAIDKLGRVAARLGAFPCVFAMSATVRSREDRVCSGPSVQLTLKYPHCVRHFFRLLDRLISSHSDHT